MRTLAGKLTVAIFVLMLTGSTISGLLFYTYERSVSLSNMSNHAQFFSNLITSGLQHDMLNDNRSDILMTLKDLGQTADVNEIHIFNRDFRITYASDHSLVGTVLMEDTYVERVFNQEAVEPVLSHEERGITTLRHYSPIRNLNTCSTAACHVHRPEEPVIGVLMTSVDVSHMAAASQRILVGAMLIGGFLVLMLSLFLFYIIHHLVTLPITHIERGVEKLSAGDFEDPIEIISDDELGQLTANFNIMATEINRYKVRLENWTVELQEEVQKKTEEIKNTQDQLLNAEKLASLGRLAAGVAHELNNPLTGIVTFAHLMRDRTPPQNVTDLEDLDMIIEQANRCAKIVKGLLSFSRKGGSEKTQVNMNDLLTHSISLLRNQAAFQDVQIVREFTEPLPLVYADQNQLQQVILNLLTNASDAMNAIGQITLETRVTEGEDTQYVETLVTDTGPGISPDNMNKILEPFFTTKDVGKGTGLGLPVSYGIIKRHGGDLLVQSKIGRGATFIIRLPVSADETQSPEVGQ